MANLKEFPVSQPINAKLEYAEERILDFDLLKTDAGREQLVAAVAASAHEGLFQIVNHGMRPELIKLQNDLVYTYFTETSLEQKDKDVYKEKGGIFEGYEPRRKDEVERGVSPTIETYNFQYKAKKAIKRAAVFEPYEEQMQEAYKQYQDVLLPAMLDLISDAVGQDREILREAHKDGVQFSHFLLYHPEWEKDKRRQVASYSGHTDIGSLTFLAANPVISLQLYTAEGWRYVPYVAGSITCNVGDALEYLTKNKMTAALHRLVQYHPEQRLCWRTALVYFVTPANKYMSEMIEADKLRWAEIESLGDKATITSSEVNKTIMALSTHDHALYGQLFHPGRWMEAKTGHAIPKPLGVDIDYANAGLRVASTLLSVEQMALLDASRSIFEKRYPSAQWNFSEHQWSEIGRVWDLVEPKIGKPEFELGSLGLGEGVTSAAVGAMVDAHRMIGRVEGVVGA